MNFKDRSLFILKTTFKHTSTTIDVVREPVGFNNLLPFVILSQMERLHKCVAGLIAILESDNNYAIQNFCIKILTRPILLDLMLFAHIETILVKGECERLGQKELNEKVENYCSMLLSDGLKHTIEFIDFYSKINLFPNDVAEEKKSQLIALFPDFFSNGRPKFKWIDPKDIIKQMLAHNKKYEFLIGVYEDYQMILSKTEHYGLLSHNFTRMEKAKEESIIGDCIFDCWRHFMQLAQYLERHPEASDLPKSANNEILNDAKEIGKIIN